MHVGKTLFAQVMEFIPWSTFHRIVDRYGGDRRARTLICAEQFRCMAFAQLTYRESLRDIEACLSAQAGKALSTWVCRRFGAPPWPMPTSCATGASMPNWLIA